ncbi:hypothetical protein KO02_18030 [Sphingobacterium sp. ML3W]|nr:hypothetical protein KO02_18030 [Sphingobacterium sp. ML3W]
MIPQTFEHWKSGIINACKINLTKDFAKQRRRFTKIKKILKHGILPYFTANSTYGISYDG